jgi:hypothetical protein
LVDVSADGACGHAQPSRNFFPRESFTSVEPQGLAVGFGELLEKICQAVERILCEGLGVGVVEVGVTLVAGDNCGVDGQ